MSPVGEETSAVEDGPLEPDQPQQQQQHHDQNQEAGGESGVSSQETTSIRRRPRTMTSTEEIDNTIIRPGSVRINVTGAFIVDPADATSSNGRGSPTQHETSDIRLPNHTAVVSHIAVDIGGSLIKLVYFSREAHSKEPGGRLNFLNFETDRIDDCIEFMSHLKENQQTLNGSQPGALSVMATGGGAYKFYDKMRHVLSVDVVREDEMECLIIGLDFFITEIPREVFTYSETDPMHFVAPSEDIYPYLLVNIGSGVSMLKVEGPRQFQRVGGTSLGGGTLWGLLSLLTGARSFDEMLDASEKGDNSKVDMLVGDIYGAGYGKIGLKSTTIASSFGKVFRMKREAENEAEDHGGLNGDYHKEAGINADASSETTPTPTPAEEVAAASISTEEQQQPPTTDFDYPSLSRPPPTQDDDPQDAKDGPAGSRKPPFSGADMSRSLLYAISNNIGQIAYLQSQIHNLSHIYFGGSFIRGHRQTINTLSYAIKFWSQGRTQAYFLRHEGYLGAVGAFLKRQPRNWGRRGSFEEDGGTVAGVADRIRQREVKGSASGVIAVEEEST